MDSRNRMFLCRSFASLRHPRENFPSSSPRLCNVAGNITFGVLSHRVSLVLPALVPQHKTRGADESTTMTAMLEVNDLCVSYATREGKLHPALVAVDLELQPGEILGVLGESGSGKSTLATGLLRLLPKNGCVTRGAVVLEGRELLELTSEELRQIRGQRISIIFQEPSLALHPTMRAGEQVSRVLAAHGINRKKSLREKTRRAFDAVFPEEAERFLESYPHQLSGGQRQRVLIAQAIACEPSVLIADEPTASLDPTTQAEILNVFRSLKKQLNVAMIFITHNPALLVGLADHVMVLYAGRVVEVGPVEKVLTSPAHPYTRALFQALPAEIGQSATGRKAKLMAIPGDLSHESLLPQGCCFQARCTEKMEVCSAAEPALINLGDSQTVSCFKYAH